MISLEKNNAKIYVEQDKSVLKMLLPSDTEETAAINNSLLRKHFRSLTKNFLAVFEHYFEKQTNVLYIIIFSIHLLFFFFLDI